MEIRNNQALAAFMLLGGLFVLAGVALIGNWSMLVPGLLLLLVGAMRVKNPVARVISGRLEMLNGMGSVGASFPIGDLFVREGVIFARSAEGEKQISLNSFTAHGPDVEDLAKWIGEGCPER